MSLSYSEIKSIRDTWEPIYQDPAGNGGLILKTFLDKHDYYHKFPRLKDAPRDTILQNPIFRNHSAKIMHTINDVIVNLEDLESLKPKLQALGQEHAERHIKTLQFEQLKVVFLDLLKTKQQISDQDHKAFTKMSDLVFPLIFKGLKK